MESEEPTAMDRVEKAWYDYGYWEGALEVAQKVLLAVGEQKFGPPSQAVVSEITWLGKVELLERLLVKVLGPASSWDELLTDYD